MRTMHRFAPLQFRPIEQVPMWKVTSYLASAVLPSPISSLTLLGYKKHIKRQRGLARIEHYAHAGIVILAVDVVVGQLAENALNVLLVLAKVGTLSFKCTFAPDFGCPTVD